MAGERRVSCHHTKVANFGRTTSAGWGPWWRRVLQDLDGTWILSTCLGLGTWKRHDRIFGQKEAFATQIWKWIDFWFCFHDLSFSFAFGFGNVVLWCQTCLQRLHFDFVFPMWLLTLLLHCSYYSFAFPSHDRLKVAIRQPKASISADVQ